MENLMATEKCPKTHIETAVKTPYLSTNLSLTTENH